MMKWAIVKRCERFDAGPQMTFALRVTGYFPGALVA